MIDDPERPGRWSRPGVRAFGVLAVCLAGACASTSRVAIVEVPDLAWPSRNPRVELDSVLDLGSIGGQASGVARWLGEAEGGQPVQRPYGVAWDGDDLILADPGSSVLARIRPDGRVSLSPRGRFEQPIGVAVCRRGIFVTDSRAGRVASISGSLEVVAWVSEDLDRPTGVACSEDGRVVIAETGAHRIVVLNPDGTRRHVGSRGSEPGQFNFPTAVAVADGVLYVADSLNFRVQLLRLDSGEPVDMFGILGDSPGEMPRLKGIAVDPRGNLWATDAYLDYVSIYDREGRFLLGIGGNGFRAGEFSFPAGVAVSASGRIAVVDSLNRRLQVFRLTEYTTAQDETTFE